MNLSLFAMVAVLGFGGSARAGVYADDLGKCLVKSTSAADKATLVRWIFAEVALNPAVASMVSITAPQRAALEQSVADLTIRVLTVDCHQPSVDALKYEGRGAFQGSFGVLGRASVVGLMSAPGVRAGLASLGTAFKGNAALKGLFKEAGVETTP